MLGLRNTGHDRKMPDFIVREPTSPPYPFPFFLVKTQNSLRALVDLAELYEASPDPLNRDLSRKMLSHALELLRRSHIALDPVHNLQVTSLRASLAAATRKAVMASRTYGDVRRLISHFDAVSDVLEIDSVMTTFAPSQEYFNTLTTLIDNLSGTPSLARRDVVEDISPMNHIDTIKAKWVHTWKEKKSERHTYMLLQVLWLGTPREVSNAMRELNRETGLAFATPSEWGDWWQLAH